MSDEQPSPEFSFVVDIGKLPGGGKTFEFTANARDREKLAGRLGVEKVNELGGKVSLSATREQIVASGEAHAVLIRECVASLELLEERIADQFEIIFSRTPPDVIGDLAEIDLLELPEFHEGDHFDIGDLLVQQISIAMNPFPRKEGARSLAEIYGQGGESSPFDVLKSLQPPAKDVD